jgi:hypothetical protein
MNPPADAELKQMTVSDLLRDGRPGTEKHGGFEEDIQRLMQAGSAGEVFYLKV